MTLTADLGIRLDAFMLAADLTIEPGEVLALLGPNGAGKSTIVSALAGLIALDEGSITLDGSVLDDPRAGVFVPAELRPVGVVHQDHLLFPHLSALENTAFGLRARGVGAGAARAAATALLVRMGLEGKTASKPGRLSGGEQQRVALARALAVEPRLLLLDEPLSALDATTRGELRRLLPAVLSDETRMTLLVTHDPVDAYVLADRVAIIEDGKVVQAGLPSEVTAHPRSAYVADLAGLNLVEGLSDGTTIRTATGASLVVPAGPSGPVLAIIRPQAISLHRQAPGGSPRNVWPAPVEAVDRHLDRVRVSVGGPIELTAEILPAALSELAIAPGDVVYVAVKASEITVSPA